MEKQIDKVILYETYKSLLTKNMQDVFEQYYYSDLSLREIGENKKVSHQAIRDTVKKVEKQINEYESKLRLYEIKKELVNIQKMLGKPNFDIHEIKKEIEKLGEI